VQRIPVPCAKVYRQADRRVLPVALAVVHWTGSPPKAPEAPDEARMRAWLADNERQTSTHLVILRDGRVLQAAALTERTWHAGGSTWTDPDGKTMQSINGRSIGIDLENVGFLRRAPDGVGFVDGYGGRYKGADPTRTPVGWHEPYTAAQIASMAETVRWLVHELPVLHDPRRWVGHCDIQAGKSDPGPLFPWPAVRKLAAEAV
jgi:N-acetyl-anhydromuramyl-L-alanine amidase AmpD